MLDIGESLVGSYLRYVENCDFVHYETYGEAKASSMYSACDWPTRGSGCVKLRST